MIGKTNSSQGVSSIPSEYVNIRMMTNQASHGDLVGAKFVLSYEKFSQEYVWGGSEMTLQVPAYVVCTIEWGDVEGYKKPEAVTFTSVEDNARTIEVEYKCELLTVNVSADEGVPTGFEVTISKAETIGGIGGYTRLEYIESSGTQYIDTGFKPNNNTRVLLDLNTLSKPSSTASYFGTRTSSSSKNYSMLYASSSGKLRSDYNSLYTQEFTFKTGRFTIDKNKETTTVDGLSLAYDNASFQCDYNLYIFANNNAGSVSWMSSYRLYSCQVYDNDALIRDYIPALRADGIAGLYDAVNDVFYPSNSDSNFIAGQEITYKKIEYIENNGSAWINTGFVANGGMKATIGITPYDVSKQYLFYGSHNQMSNSSDSTWQRNNIAIDNNSQWEVGQSTNIFTFAVSTEANEKYDVEFSTIVDAAPYAVINGQKYTGTYKAGLNIAPTTPVYIMKDVYYENQFLKGKIHYAKIWDKALNLVRDFIPVLRSDGVAGLYDLANDSFYASSGSDAFIAGPFIGEVIHTQVSASGTYKISFDVPYNIEASDIDGFETPKPVSRVANEKEFLATMEYKAVGVKDLSLMDVYGNKIQRSTANCYVVREAGQYKFPLVFGNAIKNGKVNTAAFTNNGGANSHDFVYGTPYTSYESDVITQPYINPYFALSSSDVQIETSDVDGAITDLGLEDGDECKFVTFKVANVPTTGGNVIITLNTAYGDYWSWHIWLWPHDLSPVEITNATGVKYNIMPVNLASKYDSDGIHIKNWFYQWGRPNPMLCPNAWNSTTDHSPGSITKTSKADTIKIGIMNPSKFYYNSGSPYNWFGTKSYYNLWDAACRGTGASDNDTVKTVYDPCPVGWKVPNGNTCTGFSILNDANGIVKFTRSRGDSTRVGFPMSGCRSYSDGSLNNVGSRGYVWLSSASSQNFAYDLYFHSSDVYPQDINYRACGFSVRPVEDDLTKIDEL